MPPATERDEPVERGRARRRHWGAALLVLGTVGLLGAAAGALLSRNLATVELGSDALGNFRARIDAAVSRAGSPPFRFAVLGDAHLSTRALEDQLLYLASLGDVAFAVQAGDLVPDGSSAGFQSAVATIEKASPPFPVLVAPSDSEAEDGESSFLVFAGPREVAFVAAGSLFVVADDAREPLAGERLDFLRGALERHGRDVRRTFVFLNRAPVALDPADPADAAWDAAHDELRRLLLQHRVDRVFCGHARGHRSIERDGVTYAVVGAADGTEGASVVEVVVTADGFRASRATVAAGPSPSGFARHAAHAILRPISMRWSGRLAWASVIALLVGAALSVRVDGRAAGGPATARAGRGSRLAARGRGPTRLPAGNGG